ncbi:hypothetical protein FACS189444_1040 [Spirochaetia bacterium]|nr:hypothetical protein FACS189444_1040 [Spirochaetia bacterium]
MKFRSLFLLFNSILLFFIIVIFIMPFLLLGSEFAASFWRTGWPLFLILVLILAGFDGYFALNHRLLYLLEREDWPALVQYLEFRVLKKGQYRHRLVRLLANTYLVLADAPAIMSLENRTAIVKPALVESNALVFGIARILGRDISGAVRFFADRLEAAPAVRGQDLGWLRWYYGFSLYLDRQIDAAADQFVLLVSGDGVITALAAFLLNGAMGAALPLRRPELQAAAREGRERVRKALPDHGAWTRELIRVQADAHTLLLTKYLDETPVWLYHPAGV